MISLKWKKNTSGLDKIDVLLPAAMVGTTYAVAEAVVDHIKANWSGYGSPPPSSPGETPHWVTGRLEDSMRIEQKRDLGRFSFGWVILFDRDYAAALEFGYSPRNLLPRPFIRPAVSQVSQDVGSYFEHSLDFV